MFSLYNFASQASRDELQATLHEAGYAVRSFDGDQVRGAADLWAASARQLEHGTSSSWDGYADDVARALMPDDDEPDRVALIWAHADHLATADLGAFCAAFDALTTIGRAANAQGTTLLLFFLGDGFAPLAPARP